jgi:hypothetical protein
MTWKCPTCGHYRDSAIHKANNCAAIHAAHPERLTPGFPRSPLRPDPIPEGSRGAGTRRGGARR